MISPSIFTSVINSYLPEPHASLLNGILFGINLKTTKAFYDQLRIVGLLHIVVLSGTNITLLSVFISQLTSFFSKPLSVVITILSIIIFIVFVGAQAPIIRAGFMGVLTFVAILYGRKASALYILFLSFIFIAVFWPQWISTLSLQLSYGATIGLIFFGPKNKSNLFVCDFKLSLAAQVLTAPIIFIYFKQVSFISPFTNALVSWTITPIMIFGFLAAFLGRIHFVLGLLPAYICYVLLSYVVIVVEVLSKIPFALIRF